MLIKYEISQHGYCSNHQCQQLHTFPPISHPRYRIIVPISSDWFFQFPVRCSICTYMCGDYEIQIMRTTAGVWNFCHSANNGKMRILRWLHNWGNKLWQQLEAGKYFAGLNDTTILAIHLRP
jgi:hypothetical protein